MAVGLPLPLEHGLQFRLAVRFGPGLPVSFELGVGLRLRSARILDLP
jgi:hypothetical protein